MKNEWDGNMKWYDLTNLNAKLESVRNTDGVFSLQLTLKEPVSIEKLENAVKNGWVAKPNSEGKVFNNYSSFLKLSAVKKSLEPFFNKKLDSLIVDATDLKQGERLDAYEPFIRNAQASSTMTVIDSNIANIMSSEVRERIKSRILAAQKIVGLDGNNNKKLFDGNGVDFWKSLSVRFGYEKATSVMLACIKRATGAGESFEKFYDGLLNAEAGGTLPTLTDDIDGYAIRAVKRLSKNLEIIRNMDSQCCDEETMYRNFTRDAQCIYSIWDTAKFENGQTFENDIKCVKYTSDPAMPMSWKNEIFERTNLALKSVAKIMDLPIQHIFKEQCTIHLNKFIENGSSSGMALSRYYSDFNYHVLRISPYSSGALIHETGHMLDFQYLFANNQDKQRQNIIDKLLIKTGVDKYINQVVDMIIPNYSDTKEYLKNPLEQIARTFEMSIANELREMGDDNFLSAGGVVTINGGYLYTPPADLCKEFFSEFKDQIHQSVDLSNVAEKDNEGDIQEMAVAEIG